MAAFDVCITEEFDHLVTVEAESKAEARAKVQALIAQGTIYGHEVGSLSNTPRFEIGKIYLRDDEELVAD